MTAKNRKRLLDAEGENDAKDLLDLDLDVVDELCGNLWLVVLSEKQEQLLISDEDRGLIVQERVKKGLA